MSARGIDVEPDPWLTRGLGRRALRARPAAGPGDAGARAALAAEPVFVTAKIPAAAVADGVALQDMGFRVIDAALRFAGPAPRAAGDARGVRAAVPSDRAAVEALARTAFTTSRFHLDPAFPRSLAADVKAAWAGNFFAGARGDLLFVAPGDGGLAGFLLALRHGADWVVDLIAVDPAARGRGVGRRLMAALAAAPIDTAAPARVIAGTQAANAPALAFYGRLGLAVERAEFVLHHHGRAAPYPESFAR
jgi:ribosomal protein S18 acetylase RimI-like enzyme